MTYGRVKIKIIGWQTMGEESDTTVVDTEGEVFEHAEGCIIEYLEQPAENMKVQNKIIISGGKTVISKSGAVESEMIFIPGETSAVEYQTPYGMIEMQIKCKSVNVYEEDCKSQIVITYDLYSGEQLVSHCKTEIQLLPF